MIRCPECSHENLDGLEYCDACGAKLPAVTPTAAEAVFTPAPTEAEAPAATSAAASPAEAGAAEAAATPEAAAPISVSAPEVPVPTELTPAAAAIQTAKLT